MSKYIDADKLRAEIERLEKDVPCHYHPYSCASVLEAYDNILSFLDTLSEEPGKSLEEAARHSEILTYPMPEDGDIEKVMKVQEARIFHEIGFIAGAKWQKEQMKMGGVVILAEEDFDAEKEKSVEWGYNLCREQMLKDAVKGVVCKLPGSVAYVDERDDNTLKRYIIDNFKAGDKVRIIIVKEEEQ